MKLKIFKGLLLFWCWLLICVGLLVVFSSVMSLPAYFLPEADLEGWGRIAAALSALLIAAIGAGAAWCGFRLRSVLNGTRRPAKKPVSAKTAEAVKQPQPERQTEAPKEPEPVKQSEAEKLPEPVKKPEPARTAEPVKKPDFSNTSKITVRRAEDTIMLRWRQNSSTSSAECRAAEDGYELYFVRNIHDRTRIAGKPWLKLSVRQTDSRKGFENYIGWALELDGEHAAEAAEHIRKFIIDREKQTGGKKKPAQATAGGKLAERIRHGFEKPEGTKNDLTLYEMQGIFLSELFVPHVTDISAKSGWREWIAVDLRDSRPYYLITANEIVDGRRTRYYDVKEPVTWEEVAYFARMTTDAYGKKYLEAGKDTWMQCKELWKRSHTKIENGISIEWNETLTLRREVRCTFRNGRYEVFYGGQHGPQDRTGFGLTEILPEKACESLSALQEFAKGKFESEAGSVFGFIRKHQEEQLMKARGVVRPPVSMWGLSKPPFKHERYIELKCEGRPPHEYEHEALVKVSGGWFHHAEAAWRGGYSHSDGGCSEIYLKDVNDENVEEYVRKWKNRKS